MYTYVYNRNERVKNENQGQWKYRPILWDKIKDNGTTYQNFWDDALP